MYSNEFSNQSAIITGAGQGIGFEIAKQLCLNGASVILNDIDETLAKSAANKISQHGNCVAVAGDAADVSFIQTMVDEAMRIFGRLTIAIANAGITLFGDFFEYEPEAFQRVMDVNLTGSFFLVQAAAK
ncbi:MAG: SDR family NAD(P)-dependent oxidoreductase, partial [Parafilimonas sp.]